MAKDLGKAELRIELLTEERDKYKTLYEEAAGGQGGGYLAPPIMKSPQGSAHKKSPSKNDEAGGEDVAALKEKIRILEEYVLSLDWPDVQHPDALSYLFKPTQGTYSEDEYKYSGELIRGKANGKGKKTFDNGDTSEGFSVDGWTHGLTKFTAKEDGYVQECRCIHGTPLGPFTRVYKNGDKESGCFKDGETHGVLKQVKKNGEVFYRNYVDGQEEGQVIHVWPEKKVVRICEFAEGSPVSDVSVYKFASLEKP